MKEGRGREEGNKNEDLGSISNDYLGCLCGRKSNIWNSTFMDDP